MSGKPDEIVSAAMIEQASAWQARYLSGEMTAAEKVEFLKWLQDNPRNVREYLQTARMSRLMPQALDGLELAAVSGQTTGSNVVQLPAESGEPPSPAQQRIARLPLLRIAAAVLVVCAVGFVGTRVWSPASGQRYVVPHGDQRTVRLDDGSLVHLNSNSTARVRYSAEERLVELDCGQAMFDVARDAQRPFRVRAGSTEVVAVGTQFDVYRRDAGRVTVTVVEGRVEVVDRAAPAGAGPRVIAAPVRLDVGQQFQVGAPQAAVSTVDVISATAWVRREIVFDGRPLEEVAAEFNRYLSVPVYIDDATLRKTRVSGIFSAYDEAAFVAFLREFENAQVDVDDKAIRVRGK